MTNAGNDGGGIRCHLGDLTPPLPMGGPLLLPGGPVLRPLSPVHPIVLVCLRYPGLTADPSPPTRSQRWCDNKPIPTPTPSDYFFFHFRNSNLTRTYFRRTRPWASWSTGRCPCRCLTRRCKAPFDDGRTWTFRSTKAISPAGGNGYTNGRSITKRSIPLSTEIWCSMSTRCPFSAARLRRL